MATLKPVFEFDILYDLDYAIFELAKKKFKGSKYIDQNILNLNPIDARLVLLAREDKSVFSSFLLEDYLDSANDLEMEFIERYTLDIYKSLDTTSVFDLFSNFNGVDNSVISPYVLCKSKEQFTIIDKSFGDIYTDLGIVKENYDSIYLKYGDTYDILETEPTYRTIYLANYGFNINVYEEDEFFPNEDLYDKIKTANNDIFIIDVYSDIVKPF